AALAGDTRDRLPVATTIADGIAARRVGEQTLPLARRYVDAVVTVSDEEITNAILLLLEIEKTVVEGAGAVPLAVLASRAVALEGRTVALAVSGGNIDVNLIEHDRAFARAPLGGSEVELMLKTSGREQIEAIKRQLVQEGYVAEEVIPA
ncbi:MAG TPA: pyridoxal-phosphate dependent enzyme, partial [Methylomirabilota bacterium]|nr:pyridoxal-phosphate dependent enzyme [Methylomirabilota bacterium]